MLIIISLVIFVFLIYETKKGKAIMHTRKAQGNSRVFGLYLLRTQKLTLFCDIMYIRFVYLYKQ